MRYGTPIIAVDIGAVSQTLGGKGLLLPDSRPQVVAEAIAMILDDRELGSGLSRRSTERAGDFGPKGVTRRLRDVFGGVFGLAP